MSVCRAVHRGLLALLSLSPGCLESLTYECESDAACVFEERQGQCVTPGHCAYSDATCPSMLRFGPAAGSELASMCVDAGQTTGSSESSSTSDCGPCEAVAMDCYDPDAICVDGQCVASPLPTGAPCREDDPCVVMASCDALGACIVDQLVECADPPGPCHESAGTCGVDGVCAYELRSVGTACEDGDGCTLEDACSTTGTCTPGPICASDNPCAAGSCSGSQCSFFPVVDGSGCGPQPQELCCAGVCTDVSMDAQHCGSCEVACLPDQACVAMGETGMCGAVPAVPEVPT